MERTESMVVQAAPTYENAKIKEMEMFGYNLQNRQEIHEVGDAYGAPSIFGDEYVIKVKVNHYVKLHFARNVNLPNLEKIRELERRYFELPEPEFPSLWPWGGLVGFMFLGGLWPFYFFFSYLPKRRQAEAQLMELIQRRREIVPELKNYIT